MAVSKSSPSVSHLKQALASIVTAGPALAKLIRQDPSTAPSPNLARALERLKVVRRAVEEACALAEAANDHDTLVQVALRHHEHANKARGAADELCEEQRHQIVELKREVKDLERRIAKEGQHQERVEVNFGAEREQALERRQAAAEAALNHLQAEDDELALLLSEADGKHLTLTAEISTLQQDHDAALAENAFARATMEDHHNFEAFRKARALSCRDTEEAFANAAAECEAGLAALASEWVEYRARYRASLEELSNEVRALQSRLSEKKSGTEASLMDQAAQVNKAISDAEGYGTAEMKRLEDIRQRKANALRTETVATQQRLQEAAKGSSRMLAAQLAEMRLNYKMKEQIAEAQCGDAIQTERFMVDNAKTERETLQKKVVKTRQSYRSHAIKSGAYMRSLDPQLRQQLVKLWCAS